MVLPVYYCQCPISKHTLFAIFSLSVPEAAWLESQILESWDEPSNNSPKISIQADPGTEGDKIVQKERWSAKEVH
jgi:hypothetical protein